MKYFKIISTLLITSCFALTACQEAPQDKQTITVGTISGPETQLMTVAKEVAEKKYNLHIKIVEFSEYGLPNAALNDGSIDANAFQHQAYLDSETLAKGYKLAAIGKTFVYPMAIYSDKIKNIADLPDNAIVAIPNDASNEARALLLLSKANLIKLKAGTDAKATPLDIISNPKHLQFKELDAAQLPRVLPDVTISLINTNFAVPAGLIPTKDAIYAEDKNSPYVNLIVTRSDKVGDLRLSELVAAYQSPEVEKKAKQLFNGQAIAGWK